MDRMRVVDLSQEISSEMPVFPAYPSTAILPWTKRDIHGFQAEVLFLADHAGTHVDVPVHFESTGRSVDQIDVGLFIGKGVVLDLTYRGSKELIQEEDLKEAERRANIRLEGSIALLYTAWDRRIGKPNFLTDHPGLSRSGAEYLAKKKVTVTGVDTPNIDHPDASGFPAHRELLSKGVLIIENLVNLEKLVGRTFKFIGLPLKIRGGSASPVRAVAIIE